MAVETEPGEHQAALRDVGPYRFQRQRRAFFLDQQVIQCAAHVGRGVDQGAVEIEQYGLSISGDRAFPGTVYLIAFPGTVYLIPGE